MSSAPPQPIVVVPAEDVEPLLRSARSDVARLTLRLRDLHHELAAAEDSARADDRSGARDLLGVNLDELVDRRERELERMLETVRDEAGAVVDAARAEAAAMAVEAQRHDRPEPTPMPSPPRLRVVDLRDTHPVQLGAAALRDDPDPEPVPVPVPVPVEPPVAAAPLEDHRPAELAPERLAPVVEAAVTAALAGLVASVGLLNVGPPAADAAVADVVVVDRRPLWRRFFYADVLLPLVAVFVVVVIVFAWVG